ncbi:MAG TPA: hypothetical protein VF820_06325 [Patescibacteria group bacterium]
MAKPVERRFEQQLGLQNMPVVDRTLSPILAMNVEQLEQLVRQDMQFLPLESLNALFPDESSKIQLMKDLHATRGDFFNNTTIPYAEKLQRVFLEPDAEPDTEQYRIAMEDKLRARRHLAIYFWLKDQGITPPVGTYIEFEGLTAQVVAPITRRTVYELPFSRQGRRTPAGLKLPKSERNLQRLKDKRERVDKKAPKPYTKQV